MKKNKKAAVDPLEKEIERLLAPYPDPMSRNDFRAACRIGTRTSLYLLRSGLVPCVHTGQKTRCYRIAKADVVDYLRRRLADPSYYAPPKGWYGNGPRRVTPALPKVYVFNCRTISRQQIRRYLRRQLKCCPDVLTVEQICELTGYSRHTVSKWCSEDRLKSIRRHPKYMVPKVWLLEYLCSDDYNCRVRKSRKHYEMLRTLCEENDRR